MMRRGGGSDRRVMVVAAHCSCCVLRLRLLDLLFVSVLERAGQALAYAVGRARSLLRCSFFFREEVNRWFDRACYPSKKRGRGGVVASVSGDPSFFSFLR
jgi:hypothetical protein